MSQEISPGSLWRCKLPVRFWRDLNFRNVRNIRSLVVGDYVMVTGLSVKYGPDEAFLPFLAPDGAIGWIRMDWWRTVPQALERLD